MSIIEERCYVLHGTVTPADYFALYAAEGLEAQSSALGTPLGYFATEVGELNAVVSLWRYDSFEDRQIRRRQLAGTAAWQAYLKKVRPMIASMSNRLLAPAEFSSIR